MRRLGRRARTPVSKDAGARGKSEEAQGFYILATYAAAAERLKGHADCWLQNP